MSDFSTLLILNSLSICNPTVPLPQILNTFNSKHLLYYSSSFLSKKGRLAVFIITVSLLRSLLLKLVLLGIFQHKYTPINTLFLIPKLKLRPI